MTLTPPSIDYKEIDKFSRIADEWWDEGGKFKPLHQLNPIRIKYIRDRVIKHFNNNGLSTKALSESSSRNQSKDNNALPLRNIKFVDVGCGGGLLTVPIGKLGADILGIDVTRENIKIANAHKAKHNLKDNINFLHTSVESLERNQEEFDVVLAMEVIEHVANVNSFLKSCINILKPGGLIFISTLNKTLKSYLLAIIGAEYMLRWLPIGTHEWDKFLAPSEITSILDKNKVQLNELIGVTYNPIFQKWALSSDNSVNYMICGNKPTKPDSIRKLN